MVPPAAQDAGYAGLADAWLDLQGLQPTGATRARSRAFLAAAEEAAPPGRAAPAPAPRLSRRAVLAATEPSVLTPSQACCDALAAATCQPLADAPPHASHQPPATGHQRPAICHLALIGTCHSPLTTHHLPRHRRPSGQGCPMSGWARAGTATWRGCRSTSPDSSPNPKASPRSTSSPAYRAVAAAPT